jgi:hypothetical protein
VEYRIRRPNQLSIKPLTFLNTIAGKVRVMCGHVRPVMQPKPLDPTRGGGHLPNDRLTDSEVVYGIGTCAVIAGMMPPPTPRVGSPDLCCITAEVRKLAMAKLVIAEESLNELANLITVVSTPKPKAIENWRIVHRAPYIY